MSEQISQMSELESKDIIYKINELIEVVNDLQAEVKNMNGYQHEVMPYECSVCGGNGLVTEGFYSQTSWTWATSGCGTEPCRSCKGTGVIFR